jgi:hypothetical protein
LCSNFFSQSCRQMLYWWPAKCHYFYLMPKSASLAQAFTCTTSSLVLTQSNSKFFTTNRLASAWVPVLLATTSAKKIPVIYVPQDVATNQLTDDMQKRTRTNALLTPISPPPHLFQVEGNPLSAVQRHVFFYKQLLHMFTKPGLFCDCLLALAPRF